MSKAYHNNALTGVQYGLVQRGSSSSSSSSKEATGRRRFLKDNKCILGVLASLLLVAGVIAGAIYAGHLLTPAQGDPDHQDQGITLKPDNSPPITPITKSTEKAENAGPRDNKSIHPVPFKMLGEACGACAKCPATYTGGKCKPGLECVHNDALPGTAGKCMEPDVFNENLPGPQSNISEKSVIHAGWTTCFNDRYNKYALLGKIKKGCQKSKLMMACKETRKENIALLAWATRDKVFQSTNLTPTSGHVARGTRWYFSEEVANRTYGSWGFTGENDAISRNPNTQFSCDTTGLNNPSSLQLCWNFRKIEDVTYVDSGFRCGGKGDNWKDENWERIIYQKN